MSRWVSLIVLLAVIAVTSVVMYRVMAAFLLPLFLASVLAVIFRPLHVWIVGRLPGRASLASLLTTCLIMLTVFLPVTGVATLAVREGLGAISGDVLDRAEARITRLREFFELDLPFQVLAGGEGEDPMSLTDLDRLIEALPPTLPDVEDVDRKFLRELDELTMGLQRLNRRLVDMQYLAKMDANDADDTTDMKRVKRMLANFGPTAFSSIRELQTTLELTHRYASEGPQVFPLPNPFLPQVAADADGKRNDDAAEPGLTESDAVEQKDERITVSDLRRLYRRVQAGYTAFRIDLLGGPVWSWLTDLANPSSSQLDSWQTNLHGSLRNLLPSVAGQATAILGSSLLGIAILALAVFYFLRDGPAMVQTLMKLSPLEDRYEEELLVEFETVSRAVVLATLLSALAQGLLAGVAYFFAGFDSIFLLASLTIIFALIPFIGAAAVWFPACLWLGVIEERYLASLVLFGYGVGVISMADNLIKPYVLHGQSKVHPLLALLSVLGGVQALGPIGILVGPMVVSFLQALLNILQQELRNLDKPASATG